MRIAMVTDSYYPTRDGVVTSVTTTKEALEAMGHEVFVIAPDPGKGERINGTYYFPAIRFRSYDGYYLPILPSNKIQLIKELNVDVIHVHGMAFMAIKALIAARTLKIPLVITFHTMVSDTMQYYSPIKMPKDLSERLVWIYIRNLLKRPDTVITPTKSIADELTRNGVKPKGLAVIPTGIDTERFHPSIDGSEIRSRYGTDGKMVMIHVGRISFEKNIDIVIDALSLLDDVVLMIVGKGPAEENLQKLISKKDLCDRVIFTGFVPDEELPKYYAASDAAVSASRFETQGLSILEAMACGLPAVCNNARAFTDFVTETNGYLFDGTAEDCANGIRKCLYESELKKGARYTAESFSTTSSAEQFTELYENIIRSRGDRDL